MKRLKLLLIVFAVALLSGCYKYEAKMVITDDKKVTFEAIYGMVNMDFGDLTDDEENLTDDEESIDDEDTPIVGEENDTPSVISENEETTSSNDGIDCASLQEGLGETWKVEVYKDETYQGCKISKTYANIDEISDSKEVIVDLTSIQDNKFDDKQLFKKSGDTYSAHFTFNTKNELAENDTDLSMIKDMFKVSYSVELPYANISNNATKVENDGKKLTWEIELGKDTDIKYSFNFTGKKPFPWLYVGIGCGALVVVIIIIVVISKCKSKKSSPVVQQVEPVVEPVTEVKEEVEQPTEQSNNDIQQ